MRYFDFLKEIREISVAHKLVNEYGEGDIYEYLNSGEHKYPCVFLTVTNLSTTNTGTAINFTLFYTDRLTENQSNKTAIQSTGIDVIKQLLSKFESKHPEFEIVNVNYQPFTEKFADMCAGVFVNVELDNGVDTLEGYNDCEEGDFELKTITLTANGIYDVIGYDKAVVAVENNKIKLNNINVENNCIVDGTWTGFDVFDKTTLTSLSNMFSECSDLITLDADGWVTNNVTNIAFMFSGCVNLKSLNVANWDTSNVTSIWNTFQNCQSLESLDLSGWNTANVQSMMRTFFGCFDLQSLDLSNWDVRNVYDMTGMFQNCYSLKTIDTSGWDVSSAKNMSYLFESCARLYSIKGLRNWDTSRVTNMGHLFDSCSALHNLDLRKWDASNVTDIDYFSTNSETENYIGGYDYNDVISNNISILNGLNVSANYIFSKNADRGSIRALFNGLKDKTGSQNLVLKLHSQNLHYLSNADIAVATDKNWTIY